MFATRLNKCNIFSNNNIKAPPLRHTMTIILQLSIIGVVYWVLSWLSHALAEYAYGISTIWIATGFGFAVHRVYGWKALPSIWLGALFSGISYNPLSTAAALATADMLGILIGNTLLFRFTGNDKIFDRTQHVVAFLFLGALSTALFSAWVGVTSLTLLSDLPFSEAPQIFWIWLLSNLTSVIVVAPAVLAWWHYGMFRRFSNNVPEMLALLVLVAFTGWVLYGHTFSAVLSKYPLVFIFTPIQVWAAFRLGHRGLLNLIFLSTAMAVWGTLADRGPFSGQPFPQNVLLVQAYSLVMNATTMLIHVVVYERREAMHSLMLNQDSTLLALASLAETRDKETGDHIIRTQNYVRILAEEMRQVPGYQRQLSQEKVDLLFKTSALHDIGKVGIPDAILLKPGKLTPEEFEAIKEHTTLGYNSLMRANERLGGASEFLNMAAEIALCHHEKWDGSGYPKGLKKEMIPLSGRIMALADVYDALVSARVYKKAMSHDMALDIIIEERGTHFDPAVVDAFLCTEQAFKLVAIKYADRPTGDHLLGLRRKPVRTNSQPAIRQPNSM